MFVALSVLKIVALMALSFGYALNIRKSLRDPGYKRSYNRQAAICVNLVAILGWSLAIMTMALNGFQHTNLVGFGEWIGILASLTLVYILGA